MIDDPTRAIPTPTCARCRLTLHPGAGGSHAIKIIAVADPAPPDFEAEDPSAEIDRLVRQLAGSTESELIDQVYRHLLFHLCARCYRAWIDHPAGV